MSTAPTAPLRVLDELIAIEAPVIEAGVALPAEVDARTRAWARD